MSENKKGGVSLSQKMASEKYKREKCTQKKLMFNNRIDVDILSLCSNLDNFQGYIKSLVRADIAKGDAGTFNDFLKSEKID